MATREFKRLQLRTWLLILHALLCPDDFQAWLPRFEAVVKVGIHSADVCLERLQVPLV